MMGMVLEAQAGPGDGQAETMKTSRFLSEFGETLPPIGYVNFCRSHAEDCLPGDRHATRVELTPERWQELQQVNTYVNTTIEPATDEELYNLPEYWTYPGSKGDCEDYVLLKRRYLIGLGWPASALRITVVLDDQDAGHAVLTVATDRGDLVLDNQEPEILPWLETSYTFVKRQSQNHPMVWVALQPVPGRSHGVVSGPAMPRQ